MDFFTLLDFAFPVCDLHQPGEGRTVSHSFFYKVCIFWPRLHKLRLRDLQKHSYLTLVSATWTCTVQPYLQFSTLFLACTSKYCSYINLNVACDQVSRVPI